MTGQYVIDHDARGDTGGGESTGQGPENDSAVSYPPEIRLQLTLKPEQFREFFPLLQQGVTVSARVGCTLRKLLCDGFSMGNDYVTERITTIFLDGKPVDDIDAAIVRDGASIALSAAMPGLVGAAMRRGGYYVAMRSGISHTESRKAEPDRIGRVRIKLFNILLSELGPDFLRRGVIIAASEITDFLGSRADSFRRGRSDALFNGEPVGPEFLLSGAPFADRAMVRLNVNFRV